MSLSKLALGIFLALGSGCSPAVDVASPNREPTATPSVSASATASASPSAAPSASGSASELKHKLAVDLDPTQFVVVERAEGRATIKEVAKNRFLEFIQFATATCTADDVPHIAAITATTATDVVQHATLQLQWFTQRSSVDHQPFVGVGFFVCAPAGGMIVVRYVGPEDDMKDARASLEALLEARKVVIE